MTQCNYGSFILSVNKWRAANLSETADYLDNYLSYWDISSTIQYLFTLLFVTSRIETKINRYWGCLIEECRARGL